MKIIHTGDWHAGCYRYGQKENGYHTADLELQACLREMAEEEPDLLLVAGDVYDHDHPTAASRCIVNDFWANYSRETIIIPGNHDQCAGDLTTLDPEDPLLPDHIMLALQPAQYLLQHKLWVGAVPFIANLDEWLKVVYETMIPWSEQYPDRFHILLAHIPYPGGLTDTGKIPEDVNFDFDWYNAFDYVALGDLHVAQEVRTSIWYCGSPRGITFPAVGASVREKGYICLEIHQNEDKTWKSQVDIRPCTAARKFVTLWVDNLDQLLARDFTGQVVRAIITNPQIQAHQVMALIQERGASFCKFEYLFESEEAAEEIVLTEVSQDLELLEKYFQQQQISGALAKQILKRAHKLLGMNP